MNSIFNNDRPIYLQIIDELKLEIISGKLSANEKLPSVRDLSQMLKVNPNTLQKALMELEREGLIYTERTNGKFVTQDKNIISSVKNEIIESKIVQFYEDMQKIGIQKEDIIKYLKER